MSSREKEVLDLQSFIGKVDNEVTVILQQLQWDKSYLIQKPMVDCKYNTNHRIPIDCRDAHEEKCLLWSNGYSKEDVLLPDPIDPNAKTLIKLSKNDIKLIIDKAAKDDPSFKKGSGSEIIQPFTLERLQATYTVDERRVIHDAVVNAAPSSHDLTDLTLLSIKGEENKNVKQKSRLEILAELRNMKRRCIKYRVAAAGKRDYSDVLRDVIKAQMAVYTDVKEEPAEQQQDTPHKLSIKQTYHDQHATASVEKRRYRYDEQDKLKHKSRRYGRFYGHSRHSGFNQKTDRYEKQGVRFEKYSKNYSDQFYREEYEENNKRQRKCGTEKRSERYYATRRRPRQHDIDEGYCIVKREKHIKSYSDTDNETDKHLKNYKLNAYSRTVAEERSGKRKSKYNTDKYGHSSKTTRNYSDEISIKQEKHIEGYSDTDSDDETDKPKAYRRTVAEERSDKRDKSKYKSDKYAHSSETTSNYSDEISIKQEKHIESYSDTDDETDIHLKNYKHKAYRRTVAEERTDKRDKSTYNTDKYGHSSKTTRNYSDEISIKQEKYNEGYSDTYSDDETDINLTNYKHKAYRRPVAEERTDKRDKSKYNSDKYGHSSKTTRNYSDEISIKQEKYNEGYSDTYSDDETDINLTNYKHKAYRRPVAEERTDKRDKSKYGHSSKTTRNYSDEISIKQEKYNEGYSDTYSDDETDIHLKNYKHKAYRRTVAEERSDKRDKSKYNSDKYGHSSKTTRNYSDEISIKQEKHIEGYSDTDDETYIHFKNYKHKAYSRTVAEERSGKRDKLKYKSDKYGHSSKTTRNYSDQICIKQEDDAYSC